jgi:serine/threonine protein kinase
VHVLGSFIDDASVLDDYRALDPAGDFMNPRTAFIVTPLFCGGDLEGMIKKGQKLPERLVMTILAQVIDAVVKLQKHGRAHRDLKPDNIFFCGDRESLALADFGEVGDLHLHFTKGTTSPGGAQEYLAPEIMSQIASMADGASAPLDYSKNDIYAIGMIAYKMCMCNMDASPWPDKAAPNADSLTRIPAEAYSERLRNFIERGLLSPDPSRRMSALDAQTESLQIMTQQFAGGGGVLPQPQVEPEPQPAPAAAARMVPLWQRCAAQGQSAGGEWIAYPADLTSKLEAAFQRGERHVDIDENHWVDPMRMKQKAWENAEWWQVRRIEVPEGMPPR